MEPRHELALQLDAAARYLDTLIAPLNEWRPEGQELPAVLGSLCGKSLREAITPLVETTHNETSRAAAELALRTWLDDNERAPIGYASVTASRQYSARKYQGVIAQGNTPNSPALGITLVMSPSSPEQVETAELQFGIRKDGIMQGVYIPLTPANINHGSRLEDLPAWKNPRGLAAIMRACNVTLNDIRDTIDGLRVMPE